ncbi:Uncharacterised protein [Bordetella pertussis]|nr:Uncharacterised protein [Bordetella pertussis]
MRVLTTFAPAAASAWIRPMVPAWYWPKVTPPACATKPPLPLIWYWL